MVVVEVVTLGVVDAVVEGVMDFRGGGGGYGGGGIPGMEVMEVVMLVVDVVVVVVMDLIAVVLEAVERSRLPGPQAHPGCLGAKETCSFHFTVGLPSAPGENPSPKPTYHPGCISISLFVCSFHSIIFLVFSGVGSSTVSLFFFPPSFPFSYAFHTHRHRHIDTTTDAHTNTDTHKGIHI